MSPWDFPLEYGIEPGERCGRYRCNGRMVQEEGPCDCAASSDPYCECDPVIVVVCGVCGEG